MAANHVIGTLTAAPLNNLEKILENCNEQWGGGVVSKTLLMCPVRRNVTANPSHIENFGSKDYEED
jgi:hypothetical protein